MKRAPGHALVQACEGGLAEHHLAASGIPQLAEHGKALVALAPSRSAVTQKLEVLREQRKDHGLTFRIVSLPEAGTGRAISFQRFRQLALNRVHEPLHPANAAEELNVTARLRHGLEARELGQGRLPSGWIETCAHDLHLCPGRVGAATSLQLTNRRAERRTGTLLEVV